MIFHSLIFVYVNYGTLSIYIFLCILRCIIMCLIFIMLKLRLHIATCTTEMFNCFLNSSNHTEEVDKICIGFIWLI